MPNPGPGHPECRHLTTGITPPTCEHERHETLFYPEVSTIHAHAAASKTSTRMLKIHIINVVRHFNKWGWFFGTRRRQINRQLLKELHYKQ